MGWILILMWACGAIIAIMALNGLREDDEGVGLVVFVGLMAHWFVVLAMVGALLGKLIKEKGL